MVNKAMVFAFLRLPINYAQKTTEVCFVTEL